MAKELPINSGKDSGSKQRKTVRLALALLHVLGLALVSQYLRSSKVEDIAVSINTVSLRNRQDNRATALLQAHNDTSRSIDLSAMSGMRIGSEAAQLLRRALEELDTERARRQELEAMLQELTGELKAMQEKEKKESATPMERMQPEEREKEPKNELQSEEEEKAEPTVEATTEQAAWDGLSLLQVPMQNMSIMTYNACCGLGHRLARQTAAYHAAHRLGFKLDVTWPGCGNLNVWDELFFPETEEDLVYVNSMHESYYVSNEVPGYSNAHRNCVPDELESNFDMYSNMKRRFKQRASVDSFVQEHFEGRFAIGIHIRAGNGEQGDFADKNRGMGVTADAYTQRVTKNIHDFLLRSNNTLPPVLFVATDTASYIQRLRAELEGVMPIVAWHQEHEAEGEGVFMGQHQKESSDDQCLQKWSDMLHDMMLLASTDLLLAGQFSSFSQAMPMSLVLGRDPFEGNGRESYCEVCQEGLEFVCYSNKMHWCKNSRHSNSLKTLNVDGGQWPHFMATMYNSSTYYNYKSMLQQ